MTVLKSDRPIPEYDDATLFKPPSDVSLESVLCTDELNRRPTRTSNYQAENRALLQLAQHLSVAPQTVLQKLCDAALELCRAGSAGVSLIANETGDFYWPAIAGAWNPHIGRGTPRHFGPCGVVLDRKAGQLFQRPDRYYPYLGLAAPSLVEVLLSPFFVNGEAVGTVWVVSHEEDRRFDREDMRLLESLSTFASCAFQTQQSLERLEHRAAQIETLINQAPLGVYLVDSDFRIRNVNPVARPVFGEIPGGVEGRDFGEIIHMLWEEEYAQEVVHLFRHTLDTGESYAVEVRAEVRKDRGSIEYYEWRIDRIPLPEGCYGVVCYFRDISQHIRVQEALRESEERLNLALAAGETGAWDWDMVQNTTQISPSYRSLFGLPPEASFGYEDWLQAVHPEDRDRCRTYGKEFFASPAATEWNLEFRILTPQRGLRWHRAIGRVNRAADGRPLRFIGVTSDITERKQVEQELARLNAELCEAARRKDEFLAVLAHELRNPLAPIRTGLEVMKLMDADSAIEEIRSIMERQVQQLITLVDDLLDVSRITLGKFELKTSVIDLSTVVKSAVEASRPLIDEANHNLTVQVPDTPLYLEADPHRLAQVISNLLNNAANYTPDGGRISLSIEREGSEVVISVKDNGIGIKADKLHQIFEMFVQLERPLERSYSGLGIGLMLVKSLVEMHQGRVEVFSDGEHRGSTFQVRLPCLWDAPIVEEKPQTSDGATSASPKRRVLVVDDNHAAANLLGRVVSLLGNEVRIAGDGQEALEIAAEFRPQVVLMDLGMPKMDGYETAEAIRKAPWGKQMLLVALTGWGQAEDKQRTKAAGFDRHVVKPADPATLQELFRWPSE